MNRILITFLFCLTASASWATDYFWIATSSGNWGAAANWSLSSGGAGGAGVPVAGDRAFFDANGVGNCLLDQTITLRSIELGAGYTGTFDQGVGHAIFVLQEGLTVNGGRFQGGDGEIQAVPFKIGGGDFISTSGRLATGVLVEKTGGTFSHNNGLFRTGDVVNINGDFDFYDAEIVSTATNAIAIIGTGNVINVLNDFRLEGATNRTSQLRDGTINVFGDLILENGGQSPGFTQVQMVGTGNQSILASADPLLGAIPNLTINKPSGDLNLSGSFLVAGNLKFLNGNVVTGTAATDKITLTGSPIALEGTVTLNNLEFAGAVGATLEPTNVITILGDLTHGATSQTQFINGGRFLLNGDLNWDNSGSFSRGTTTYEFVGTGAQAINGTAVSTFGGTPDLEINKPSGTLTLNGTVKVGGNWTLTQGTVAQATGAGDLVNFNGGKTITGNTTLNNVAFGASGGTVIMEANTTLTVNGTLSTIASTNALDIDGAGLIVANGNIDWNNSGTFSGGTATIELAGTANQTITNGVGTAARFPDLRINKTSGTVSLAGQLYITRNLTLSAGTITSVAGNEVVFADAATAGGSATGYIDGPALKNGGGCFLFPVGKGGQYRPIMAAGGNAGDVITAEYFNAEQTLGTSTAQDLTISTCEHWTLTRTLPTQPLIVALAWGSGSCNIAADLNDMRVAGWDGSTWLDLGNGGTTGDATAGMVNSSETISNYIAFTLGNASQPDPNTTCWVGAVSTDWFDPANWTNGRPTGTKNAVIGDVNFTGTFQPQIITRNATAKTLHLGQGTIPVTLQTVDRNLKVKGDIFIGGNGTLDATKLVRIEGSWINEGGTFTANTSRVIFEKAFAPQVITNETFYNVNLKAQNGFDISLAADIQVLNNLKVVEGNFRAGNHTITVDHKWTDELQGFVAESSTVIFTAAQDPNAVSRIPTETFYNLHVNAPGRAIKPKPESVITVNGDFHVIAGTFNHKQDLLNACTVTGNGTDNEMIVFDGATVVNRQPTFQEKYVGFETITLQNNSTVVYQSQNNIAQTIDASFNYGNLHIRNNTPKVTAGGDLNVLGNLVNLSGGGNDLTLESGITARVLGNLELGKATLTADGTLFRLDGDWISGKFVSLNNTPVGFAGTTEQNINEPNLVFPTLIVQNSGDGIRLNQPLQIDNELRLNNGVITTDATNVLTLGDNAVVNNASDLSFVHGPVVKIGDDAFTFPTGDITAANVKFYSPIAISAPSAATSALTAEYKSEGQTFGTTLGSGVESISDCQYWTLESTSGTENVNVTLGWNQENCAVNNISQSTVAEWDGSAWQGAPLQNFSADPKNGSVTAGVFSLSVGFKKPFVVSTAPKPPTYAHLQKEVINGYQRANDGKLHFFYQERYNPGATAKLTYQVFDEFRQVVAESDANGLTSVPGSPLWDVVYGQNWVELDLSSMALTAGKFYVLEVQTPKGESFYLRFQY